MGSIFFEAVRDALRIQENRVGVKSRVVSHRGAVATANSQLALLSVLTWSFVVICAQCGAQSNAPSIGDESAQEQESGEVVAPGDDMRNKDTSTGGDVEANDVSDPFVVQQPSNVEEDPSGNDEGKVVIVKFRPGTPGNSKAA